MSGINAPDLVLAMERTPITTTQLATAVGVSLSYMCDITAGRRNLKRNPALRRRIAVALNVPQHWIEAPDGAADQRAAIVRDDSISSASAMHTPSSQGPPTT